MRATADGGAIEFDRLSAAEHTRAIHETRRGNRRKFQHRASATTKRRESIRDNREEDYQVAKPPLTHPRSNVSRRTLSITIYTLIA